MKDLIVGFGNQLRHALEIGANASLKQNNKDIHNVMITGLGDQESAEPSFPN